MSSETTSSGDDPGGLIGDAYAMGAEFPGPAQDLFLDWALRLKDTTPQAAAARLLQRHRDAVVAHDSALGELVRLLEEAARDSGMIVSKRRGGRARRNIQTG